MKPTVSDYALFATHSYVAEPGQEFEDSPASKFNAHKIIRTSDPAAGFFAVAYDVGDEIVIAYEGTNFGFNLEGLKDVALGWIGAVGIWQSAQSKEAVAFYNQIEKDFTKPIVTTGHSLGGGLAGLVADIKGTNAVVFDNMPFELAALRASVSADLAVEIEKIVGKPIEEAINDVSDVTKLAVNAALFPIYGFNPLSNFVAGVSVDILIDGVVEILDIDDLLLAKKYDIATKQVRDGSQIDAFSIKGEVLTLARAIQSTTVEEYDGFFGGTERRDFFEVIEDRLSIVDLASEAVAAHSMDLLASHVYLDENSNLYDGEKVAFIGGDLVGSLFDTDVANSAGYKNSAEMFRGISLSSAVEDGVPFGTVALDSLFSDAVDAGSVLDRAVFSFNLGFTSSDFAVRGALSDDIVTFSGGLARLGSVDAALKEGFLRSTDEQTLTIDYSDEIWRMAGVSATDILGRETIIDRFDFDDYFSAFGFDHNVEDAMRLLWGSASADALERLHFSNTSDLTTGLTLQLAEIDSRIMINGSSFDSADAKGDIAVGTNFDDKIVGSSRNEIIDGGAGSDTLVGGGGDDILVASTGNSETDFIDGGSGDDFAVFLRDLNDYHFTALEASHEYDFLVRELTFIQNPFTPPSFTGNEVFLKNIQFGQFDGNKIYEFGADGPIIEKSNELKDSGGSNIGVFTIEAPSYSVNSDIAFKINLSTSGVGTQYKVALIVDVSGSMIGSKIVDAKAAYIDLIGYLKTQGIADVTEFAVIPFASGATLYEGLNADEAISRINSLNANGGTNFDPAIQRGLEFFDGITSGLTNIAYFLSDGEGSGASAALQAVADVRAFGIGSGASISSLNTIDSNSAVILSSSADLAASFTESEIKTADVDRIEVSLNNTLIETIVGDQLIDNGATGLSFSSTISGLDPANADALYAKVIFKDASIPSQTVTFEVGDGRTDVAGTAGDDNIAFSLSQRAVDAGAGTDTVLGNDLDNIVVKTSGNGVIKTFGGNDTVQAGDNRSSGLDRVIDGGDGTDTVVYVGNYSEYTVSRAGGLVKVGTATDSLSNVEFLQFDDVRVQTSDLTVASALSGDAVVVTEENSNISVIFTVKLDVARATAVSFDYQTINGTAKAGSDFVIASGSSTLLPGELEKTIAVEVVGDTIFESEESFEIKLSNANGAIFEGGASDYSIIATIINDDTNVAPTAVRITLDTVAENSPNGKLVGTLFAVDPDEIDPHEFVLIDDANGRFRLNGSMVEVASGAAIDFESAATHEISVRAIDAFKNSFDQLLTISIKDVNESPALNDLTIRIDENTTAGTVVATLAAFDQDSSEALTYALTVDGGGLFETSGADIIVSSGAILDFESTPSFALEAQVTDASGLKDTATVTVNLNDLDDNSAPSDIVLDPMIIAENSVGGTVIGDLATMDENGDDAHTYRLITNPFGLFGISGASLVLADDAVVDFETAKSHDITIQVTDEGGLSFEKSFTVSVIDVEEIIIRDDNDDGVLIGNSEDNELLGDGDDETHTGGAGADIIRLDGGRNIVSDTLTNFNGDEIFGFGSDDQIEFLGQRIAREAITVESGSAIITARGQSFTLNRDFSDGDFMAWGDSDGDTRLGLKGFLTELSEGANVSNTAINGIVATEYLSGDTAQSFEVTFEADAGASFNNSIGVYEVDSTGDIVSGSARIIAANAKSASTVTVDAIGAGNEMSFFLIQNGATLGTNILTSDTLSFIDNPTGSGLVLANNGAAVGDATTFFSHDATANVDGAVHTLSGVSGDGLGALRIGFEDLLRDGDSDDDFQDVVLYVNAVFEDTIA